MTTSAYQRPADFDTFWQSVLDDLARLPMAPEVEEILLRSTDFATVYGVRLTSIGLYRIFGYLSVPRGPGPFPARYFLPRYGSVSDLVPQGTATASGGITLPSPSASGASAAPTVPTPQAFPASLPTAPTTRHPTSTGASWPTAAGAWSTWPSVPR